MKYKKAPLESSVTGDSQLVSVFTFPCTLQYLSSHSPEFLYNNDICLFFFLPISSSDIYENTYSGFEGSNLFIWITEFKQFNEKSNL